jgi:ElaB/YqjD/DUF883 family membrane-anchored ribosome-binding protein
MQGELVELMKHEYEKRIQEIENDLQQVEDERKTVLTKVPSSDSKQAQVIDGQFRTKIEDLQKQLVSFKEKEKKQE